VIVKLEHSAFLSALRHLGTVVNGSKKNKVAFDLIALSTLGPDCLVLWAGDVQRFIQAQVLDSGGFVLNLRQLIAFLETFNSIALEIWSKDSEITFKAEKQKFVLNTVASATSIEAFQKEQLCGAKKLKKAEEKMRRDFMGLLKLGQEVSYIDEHGQMQTGAIFLGFVNVMGKLSALLATHDRKSVTIDPSRIGRVFNHMQENPLSRRML